MRTIFFYIYWDWSNSRCECDDTVNILRYDGNIFSHLLIYEIFRCECEKSVNTYHVET